MLFPRIVLCFTLILASTSFAQTAVDAPLAGPWDAAPPHGDLFQSRGRRASAQSPDALRVLAEMGGGVLGGALLGLVGLAVGQGYEISHTLNRGRRGTPRIESSSGPGLRVAPVAGMTPRGGFLGGLSGSF